MHIEDLTGKIFERWTVVGRDPRIGDFKKARWWCKCQCGTIKSVSGSSLRAGTSLGCGCKKAKDWAGKKFNRWTGIERFGTTGSKWLWRCDCGTERVIQVGTITHDYSKSCGCYKDEVAKKFHTKHGKSYTRAYNTWESMKDRCFNPNHKQWKHYGGRGITVCEEWKNSFEAFHAYVGDPDPGMSLVRYPNNDGNYEPGNVRWASRRQQANNRRPQSNSMYVNVNGERLTISALSKRLGVKHSRLYYQLNSGWTLERILAQPPDKYPTIAN